VGDGPLRVTERLLARYAADPSRRWQYRSARVDAAVRTILRHGSGADAAALLPAFLADPEGRWHLLPVLGEHGDATVAEALLAVCFDDGWLRPGAPEDVLQVIGYLGYEPATALLWRHAGLDANYGAQTAAFRGLIHLPCTELADEIDAALTRHHFRNLFPEFLPALAPKTGDPSWPARLYDWGSRGNGFGFPGASTDCNAGLLLGLALYGEAELFARALWNPDWETYSGSTGTVRSAYAGTRITGMDAATLHAAMHTHLAGTEDARDRVNAVLVLTNLLGVWLDEHWLGLRPAAPSRDTAVDVYELVFCGDRPVDEVVRDIVADGRAAGILDFRPLSPLTGLAGHVHRLETRLELAAAHETELAELRPGGP
jgi:hypothetical protein